MRKVTALLIAILILILTAIPASASVMPRYSYTDYVYSRIEIDTTWGIATCVGEVMADDEVPVKLVVYLQVYKDGGWQTVKSWQTEDNMNAYLNKSYAIYRGYEYRCYVVGYIYNSNNVLVEIVDSEHSLTYN